MRDFARAAIAAYLEKHGAPFCWFTGNHGDVDDIEWNSQKPTREGNWRPLYLGPAQAESTKRVYLVATGEIHEGEETYTRHDDAPPPLCDAECLFTNPQPTPQERQDAARLDWLEQQVNNVGEIHLHDGEHPRGSGIGLRPGRLDRTLREAIDAAMSKEPGHE